MKKFHYILVLSVIFTVYLFPQTEENETIKVDKVTRVDTIVVEQQEKKDFKQYDFYNDYLSNLQKTNDTLVIDNSKKTLIFSARFGNLLLTFAGSITLDLIDLPIIGNASFATKCFYVLGGDPGGSSMFAPGFGLGLGVYRYSEIGNIIGKLNIYPSLSNVSFGLYGNKKVVLGLNTGYDIIFGEVFSIGIDIFIFPFIEKKGYSNSILLTVGLNKVY
jgi:hypothetical protein